MKKLAVLLLIATTALAQSSSPLVETMEVRVISVDVVVTDSRGNRATGLTKDDFELLVAKKPVSITNFSEIAEDTAQQAVVTTEAPSASASATTPGAAQRGKAILFFIDASSLDPRRRHEVFDQLRKFTGDVMRPGDRAMVASWNRRLQTAQAFTESPDEIRRAIDRMQKDAGGLTIRDRRREVEQRVLGEIEMALMDGTADAMPRAYNRALGHARTFSEEVYAHARTLMVSMTSMLSALAAPEDRKALVFVGDYMPSRAGAEMFQYVEDAFRPHNIKEVGAGQQMQALSTATWQERIVRAANAKGITAYMISAGGMRDAITDVTEASVPASTMAPTLVEMDTQRTFAATAEETGGLAFIGGDPAKAFQQIADDFRSYYSLGFRPADMREGKKSNIVVRVKKPGYTVRARRNYSMRSLSEEMSDRVMASLYDTTAPGEIAVRAALGKPVAHGRTDMKLPVRVYVQGANVTLIPQGNSLAGELTVFVCAGGDSRGASKVLRHTQRLKVPAADEERFRSGHLTFAFDVIVERKGENKIAAGVLDDVSGSYGLARTGVRMP